MMPHSLEFYARDTVSVAKDLLGSYLVRRIGKEVLVGKIVEVEAYLGEHDPACHASAGKTERTRIFWGRPGLAYVFLIYGLYHCLNAITLPEGQAGCVLIRALEPQRGLRRMVLNRYGRDGKQVTNGPGKLCQAFRIDLSLNGTDLTNEQSQLYIAKAPLEKFEIKITQRIGINKAAEEPLRFAISNNSYVSKR
jgi:DNA-3-methyladenine glycosylase